MKKPRELGLAKRVKAEREALGISQSELARRLEINQSAISKIESGENPDIMGGTLLKMSLIFNVRPWWLYWGKGPRERVAAPIMESVAELIRSHAAPAAGLKDGEREMIEAFKNCSPAYQRMLIHMAKNEPSEDTERKIDKSHNKKV